MTLQNDTLVCDTARLLQWQTNPQYDYNRELLKSETNGYDWLNELFNKLLRSIFGHVFADKYSETIFIIIFIVAILLVLWFLYKKRPELFMRNRKVTLPYTVEEDTIYGVDFDQEISKALSAGDYRNAARFVYLQTLKHLTDNELIEWQLYKTPTQYIYEIKPDQIRTPFRELTNNFLRVRYGNYEADEPLFNKMKALQQQVQKGGSGEIG